MQGKQNAIGSKPETLGFNYGSTSSDGGIDQQICWNNLRNPAPNRLSDCMVSSNDTNIQFFHPMSQERRNIIGWSLGESSSSGAQNNAIQGEQKTDNGWSSALTTRPGPSHFCEKQQYGSSDILSLSNVEVNANINQIANNTSFSRGSSSSSIPHDLKRNSGFEGQDDDDDSEVMECTPAYKSSGPGKERMPTSTSSDIFAGPSGTNEYLMDVSDGRLNCSSDGQRLSCKRKTLEGHLVQSSGSGSLNYIPLAENSLWNSVPAPHNPATGANRSAPTESSRNINFSEQVNPRLGLTMGRATRETPGLPASRSAESSNRNFRVRINGSHQQDSIPYNLFPDVGDVGNLNLSSERHSSRVPRNSSLDLRSVFAADNGNPQMQPVVPSLRRSAQARLNLASSSRAGSSMSSSSFSLSGYRNSATCEEPNSRSVPRSISQHPMFIPSTDGRSLNQNPANWNVAGGNIPVAGNVASTSRSSSSSGAHSSSPTWAPHRNHPQFPRRLPQFVRRALSSSAGTEPVGHTGNSPPLHLSSVASQGTALSGNHGHRSSTARSAMVLERHLDSAIGVPYSWRTSAAASEGRSRLVSEIRNVLDRMRRGEGLRFEDVMILDQSVFLGMTDIHDRHRDMRLDVDNMTYEELLALEERIGNVCTGLSEETICSQLKQRKFICRTEEPMDAEPCAICQEEYKDGVDVGTLSCGHDFHRDCIKQWLTHKNLCPICKTTGLST